MNVFSKGRVNNEEYRITLDGKGGALICGCLAVCRYSETEISIKLKRNILTVCGLSLTLKAYLPGELEIIGEISDIHIERRV